MALGSLGAGLPAGQFVVDLAPLIWQWSLMVRSTHSDARETHHTVSAGILDALGRGFLIATAGVMAGLMFGTAHLAALSLWTVAVAATGGVACMVGSALVRNAGCAHCEEEAGGSPRAAEAGKARAAIEVAEDVEPEERWARRMAAIARRREHGPGRGA